LKGQEESSAIAMESMVFAVDPLASVQVPKWGEEMESMAIVFRIQNFKNKYSPNLIWRAKRVHRIVRRQKWLECAFHRAKRSGWQERRAKIGNLGVTKRLFDSYQK